jgi:hypothetical protein
LPACAANGIFGRRGGLMNEESRTPQRVPRLSVAGLMEMGRIREGTEALDRHRQRVVFTIGAALLARLLLEVHSVRAPGASVDDAGAAVAGMALSLVLYAAALWFLALRGHDRFGFGIALGAAVVEGTPQLVSLARGMLPEGMTLLAPVLVVITHLALAVAAFQASRDFPSESSSGPWIKGFVVATLFIIAVPAMRARAMRTAGGQVRVLSRPQTPSTGLRASIDLVHQCARQYAEANPRAGYPRSLRALGPTGSNCIRDSLAAEGDGAGWTVTYTPGDRDGQGRTSSYTILARQSATPGQGVGFFLSDQSGVIRPTRAVGR